MTDQGDAAEHCKTAADRGEERRERLWRDGLVWYITPTLYEVTGADMRPSALKNNFQDGRGIPAVGQMSTQPVKVRRGRLHQLGVGLAPALNDRKRVGDAPLAPECLGREVRCPHHVPSKEPEGGPAWTGST